MCIHSTGSASIKPQMQFPKLETGSAPSFSPFTSFASAQPQSPVAREYARDSFTAAPAVSVPRPRIDLG
jgi:hypothetical protein